MSLEQAKRLAAALAAMWSELSATRGALAQREAELAGGVPLVVRSGDDDSPPLGTRLEAVLRAGAEAINCQAAALYLLDPATTELKLRAAWGLPRRRLTEPARPLRGALADLEALLGHAVVTNDERLYSYWKVPEQDFAACVCVPVLTQSMPLGTLWAFSREVREFSDAQTNILEVVAGRIAADLERETLVGETLAARDRARQLSVLEGAHTADLPMIAPVIEGWEVAGAVFQTGALGGSFYDWLAIDDDGALAVLAGVAGEGGLAGALTASALRAGSRAVGREARSPSELLARINSVLWSTSSGTRSAGLFHAVLEPGGGACALAVGGPLRVIAVRDGDCTAVAGPTAPLGIDDTAGIRDTRHRMTPGDTLLVYGTSSLTDAAPDTLTAIDEHLAAALSTGPAAPAELVELATTALGSHPSAAATDRVVVVIRSRAR